MSDCEHDHEDDGVIIPLIVAGSVFLILGLILLAELLRR